MSTKTQKKNQNFVLFWLGVLTGALLIVAFYTLGAGDADDMVGKLRVKSANTYTMPTDMYNGYTMPTDMYNGYTMPTDMYNGSRFVVPRNFQNGLFKPRFSSDAFRYTMPTDM